MQPTFRQIRGVRLALAVAIAFAAARPLSGAEPPARWTPLTPDVQNVCVAPDGRVWSRLPNFSDEPMLAELDDRALVAREFTKPNPRVNLPFALFDDQGRAWFYGEYGRRLLGYDGKTWIERLPGKGERFRGECPTRGQFLDNASNRSIGGVCWFIDERGIHRFDGKAWTYLDLSAECLSSESSQPQLAVSPNGRYVVAGLWKMGHYWVHDGSNWKARVITRGPPQVGQFIVTDAGVIRRLNHDSRLGEFALTVDERAVERRFMKLLPQLGDRKFAVREQASAAIQELLAELPDDRLEAEQRRTADSEVRARLGKISAGARKTRTDDLRHPISHFAGYRMLEVRHLDQDRLGRVYVKAEEVVGHGMSAKEAVIVAHPDGRTTLIDEPRIAANVPGHAHGQPRGILTRSGQSAWLSLVTSERGAVLYDFAAGRVAAATDDCRYTHFRAVDDADRLYTSVTNLGPPLMLLDPAVPDLRKKLPVTTTDFDVDMLRVAEDGTIWVHRPKGPYLCFDGHEWHTLQTPGESPYGYFLISGADGVVMVGSPLEYMLFRGTTFVDRDTDILQLIARHRDLIAPAFAKARGPARPEGMMFAIDVDRRGNIWHQFGRKAQVLVEKTWLTVPPPSERAPADTTLPPAEDPGFVYIWSDEPNGCCLARVENGKITTRPAPKFETSYSLPQGLRESDGTRWIFSQIPDVGWVQRRYAARLGRNGVVEEIDESGKPILIDRTDHVWLNYPHDSWRGRFVNIWHSGRVVQKLTLRGSNGIDAAISDAPGSVYAWTAFGLQHFLDDDPTPGGYRLGEVYAVPGLSNANVVYSKLGYLVSMNGALYSRNLPRVQLVKLPPPVDVRPPAAPNSSR